MSMRPDSDDSDDVAAVDLSLDLSLIDALLALTPQQRLLQNDRMLQTDPSLRDGFATLSSSRPYCPGWRRAALNSCSSVGWPPSRRALR